MSDNKYDNTGLEHHLQMIKRKVSIEDHSHDAVDMSFTKSHTPGTVWESNDKHEFTYHSSDVVYSTPHNDTGLGQKITKGKDHSYPAVALKILGYASAIGDEKGYKTNSWWVDNNVSRSYWLDAAKRHITAYEEGSKGDNGYYTEYKPDGTPCKTKANHIFAAAWNLMRVAMSIYFKRDNEDDRWLK